MLIKTLKTAYNLGLTSLTTELEQLIVGGLNTSTLRFSEDGVNALMEASEEYQLYNLKVIYTARIYFELHHVKKYDKIISLDTS